jgi:hypothetical protein
MDVEHARLLKRSLDLLIENMNMPLYIAQNFCDDDTRKNIIDIFGKFIGHIDYDIIKKIHKQFPELAEEDKKET